MVCNLTYCETLAELFVVKDRNSRDRTMKFPATHNTDGGLIIN